MLEIGWELRENGWELGEKEWELGERGWELGDKDGLTRMIINPQLPKMAGFFSYEFLAIVNFAFPEK